MPIGLSVLPAKPIEGTNRYPEVYYGESSVAVPFTWESQPGIPKVKSHEKPLPSLAPPPSFNLSSIRKPVTRNLKPNLLQSLLPRLGLQKRASCPLYSSLSSSSPSSSYTIESSVSDRIRKDPETKFSTTCFGIRWTSSSSPPSIFKVLRREFE